MTRALMAVLTGLLVSFNALGTQKLNTKIDALLSKHCYDCHDEDRQKGDVRLDNLTELSEAARFEMLNRIEEQVFISHMPPKKKKQPTVCMHTRCEKDSNSSSDNTPCSEC